ncbi:MAG: phosphoribosylformylglycinamidine synthase subunit PurL [Candidatus Methanoliparum thermophilum]|uniref:Phosphoribosylformylglycinamidine synthase subunit PurL n=1 Tax=Methanoliparum thermophilum TaxID=2491083 RepID=A0A520KR03_METT2|nr:phosphoribosylformylglycinamidine synthase subunit PurL [Candidatus Methanoliparum sp. LAM-1]RZN64046.1 MAG: phosphoribosylformylglycinamidine synthase subunit PurL [Candidatus Methanoliparum thermophilum]BDC35699.1 phosphoribosylformylglycinamidine synthase [Candidatus Methanoliparum sp. LAM-1]
MYYLSNVKKIDLSVSEDQLEQIGREMGLGLNRYELGLIKDYFKRLNRDPTDIELQSLAQAWSEHCCYKSSKNLLKRFILSDSSQGILLGEDAGIIDFNEEYAYAVAFESHNHPSNVEPYGGAATGIGGVVRDILCMGAKPIALIDSLFFGLPDRDKRSKFLFNGVISGIGDYGNRIGVPTVAGIIYFDEGYKNNCLVNAGCVGIVKKSQVVPSRSKEGNLFVLTGGKTGRDGIHGVTFASAELSERSEEDRSAVQLGNPILEEPLIHACLEVTDKGLVDGMKDLGGGGLSCAIGEMSFAAGCGACIEIEKVPLKEEGMHPWEILVSESQERMMLSISPDKVDEVLEIFDYWDVPATIIGRSLPGNLFIITYYGEKIYELELDFLINGIRYDREIKVREIKEEKEYFDEPKDYNSMFLSVLSSLNICSRESVIRRYDHEVGGRTILKPLNGGIKNPSHGDAAVIKPLEDSYKGLAISAAINPSFMGINPYKGALSAVDEVCRNLVSVGARPHSLADTLNFGNPEKPIVMGDFYESVRALGEIAKELKIPYASGNVSFYNERSQIEDSQIVPTPSLFGVGIVEDIRKVVTSDIKGENLLYLIGDTYEELGGSEYLKIIGKKGVVPSVDVDRLRRSIEAVLNGIKNEIIISAHDVSEGGIAVAVAEMCMGGGIGADLDISGIKGMRSDIKLFSESNTRWLVEVKKDDEKDLIRTFMECSVSIIRLGETRGDRLVIKDGNKDLLNVSLIEMYDTWSRMLEKIIL